MMFAMPYSHTIRGIRYSFKDLKDLMAKANERKSGDELAEIAATTEQERVAAKLALADVTLGEIVDCPLLDPGNDNVSRLILDTYHPQGLQPFRSMTVGTFREWLLAANGEQLREIAWSITPEIAAALTKLMANKELIAVASRIRNITRLRNTMGQHGVLGIRLQPNHPTDNLHGILVSALDGLLFGCGDAVIGVNPANDSVASASAILHGLDRLITTCDIPTQACCLAHITTQLKCLEQGVPVDLLFQSIAGTQAANQSFGVTIHLLKEGRQLVQESHQTRNVNWTGNQVMYFETGQGSALSAEAHHGVDQVTLEARAYGLARTLDPFLVNSVVGFIGPEYLFDERQIIRAGLEDHFMGKLLGLPMGVDVCYTNHADADQNSCDNLMMLLAAAGCNYFMGVPCADDVMLNYQSTSYHDAALVREVMHLRPAPEFLHWLERMGIFENGMLTRSPDRTQLLLSQWPKLLEG